MKPRILKWGFWVLALCLGMAFALRGGTIMVSNSPPSSGSWQGNERMRPQNYIRPYECDFGFTNCSFAIGGDFHVVATNTLAMMERIVIAQCLLAEAVGVLNSDYPSYRLRIDVEYLPDRDALRRDIRSVLLCDDDEVADRINMLRDTMLSLEKRATCMIGDGSALKEKETPIARQHENIQTNGLLECNLDEVLVDLWDFDSWDAPTPVTNVANSQISNSTKEDLRDVSTTGFANPNLNLIFVFMRTHYMSIMYEEFCAALLIRLRGQKGGGEGRTTSENSK